MKIIYISTNLINNKIYIGCTKNLNARISQHKSRSKKDGNGNFWGAIREYGFNNFAFCPIVFVEDFDGDEAEQMMIERFDSANPEIGYNMTKGGKGSLGYIHTQETKSKMRGRERTENHCRKLGESLKGRTPWNKGKKCNSLSEEHKKKISGSSPRFSNEDHPMYIHGLKNDDIAMFRNIGMSIQSIADMHDTSYATVWRRIKKMEEVNV